MKAVIQRVSSAKVTVSGETVGEIQGGFMVLLGVSETDTEKEAEVLAAKTAKLRVFCDSEDKMNLSLLDVSGEALVVSNFTLCADTKKGNRPSFINAKEPIEADRLYKYYCEQLLLNGVKKVETGRFKSEMQVSIVNEGPITIVLDTDMWCKKNEN